MFSLRGAPASWVRVAFCCVGLARVFPCTLTLGWSTLLLCLCLVRRNYNLFFAGYKAVIITDKKCSKEKIDAIQCYGAELRIAKPGENYMTMELDLGAQNPDWFCVNQCVRVVRACVRACRCVD